MQGESGRIGKVGISNVEAGNGIRIAGSVGRLDPNSRPSAVDLAFALVGEWFNSL